MAGRSLKKIRQDKHGEGHIIWCAYTQLNYRHFAEVYLGAPTPRIFLDVVVVVVWPDGLGHAPTTSSKPALLFFFILSGDTADLTTRKTQKRPQLVGKYE